MSPFRGQTSVSSIGGQARSPDLDPAVNVGSMAEPREATRTGRRVWKRSPHDGRLGRFRNRNCRLDWLSSTSPIISVQPMCLELPPWASQQELRQPRRPGGAPATPPHRTKARRGDWIEDVENTCNTLGLSELSCNSQYNKQILKSLEMDRPATEAS